VLQARTVLKETQVTIARLEANLRQEKNSLAILKQGWFEAGKLNIFWSFSIS